MFGKERVNTILLKSGSDGPDFPVLKTFCSKGAIATKEQSYFFKEIFGDL